MKKKNKKSSSLKLVIVIAILAVLVLVYYYHLSSRRGAPTEETDVTLTVVQEVLSRNLTANYPPTPKEVVRYYSDITECFYNEEYTEEEFQQLAVQIQGLYDKELIANKTQEQYITDLQTEILTFREMNYTISSYTLSSSVDIENSKFTRDGYEWAKVYCYYSLSDGTRILKTSEVFLLRKDEEGHWKIYGWDLADGE